jgi:hypothetical protein
MNPKVQVLYGFDLFIKCYSAIESLDLLDSGIMTKSVQNQSPI